MRSVWVCLSLGFVSLLSVACSKADPGFQVLDANVVPQPLFNGATSRTIQSATGAEMPLIEGECDYKISFITAQIVELESAAGSLDHVSTGAATVACQTNGTFKFRLKTLADLGFTLVQGKTYEFELRGFTSSGVSKATSLKVHYDNNSGRGANLINYLASATLSGSSERAVSSNGNALKAVIRLTSALPAYNDANLSIEGTMQSEQSASGHLRLKFSSAARAH